MVPSTNESQSPSRQFNLSYLFVVVTTVAVGLALFFQSYYAQAKLLGLSIILFWLARAIFAFSGTMPTYVREALFLLALPLYLGCVMAFFAGCISILFALAATVVEFF